MAEVTHMAGAAAPARDGRVVGLISAAHFVSHVYLLLLPPMFALIKADLGIGYAELGVVLAAFNTVSAVMQTPAGFAVDRLGARPLLVGGLALGATAVALAGLFPSYAALVLCFAFAGLANTVYHPADYAILSQLVRGGRVGTAFSIHTFFGMLGGAVAPATMLFLANLWGWRGALVAVALLGYAAALAVLVHRRAFAESARSAGPERAADAAAVRGVGWQLLFSAPILRNVAFFIMMAMASGGISNFSVVALGALYGTPLAVANFALSAFLLLSALGVLAGGFVADRTRHHHRVAAMGFAASAVILFLVATVPLAAWVLIPLMALAGLLNGLIMPSRDMIVRAVTPEGSFGKVFGFVSTGFNIGGVISPLIYGSLMDAGEPRAVFLVVVGCTLLSLLTVGTGSHGRR
jgi:MFS family permease